VLPGLTTRPDRLFGDIGVSPRLRESATLDAVAYSITVPTAMAAGRRGPGATLSP